MTTFDCSDPIARRAGLEAAASAASGGQLVVIPTDTVYGLGADAFNAAAVRRLLEVKGRGPDMPVPVLVGSWTTVDGLVTTVSTAARTLIEAFWPGGLSLVMTHAPSLAWDLGDTAGTVMIRMPMHPVALDLLRTVGPMAVSSANRSGQPARHHGGRGRRATRRGRIGVPRRRATAPVGVASTIVDLTGDVRRACCGRVRSAWIDCARRSASWSVSSRRRPGRQDCGTAPTASRPEPTACRPRAWRPGSYRSGAHRLIRCSGPVSIGPGRAGAVPVGGPNRSYNREPERCCSPACAGLTLFPWISDTGDRWISRLGIRCPEG